MFHIPRHSLIRPVAGLGLLALALVVAVRSAEGAVAVLDPSFGGSGMMTTPIGTSAAADAVVVQPDGKIVAAGGVVHADASQDFALARYQSNGSLDPTFGSGGIVQSPAGTARAVALQPDGKIVAAGTTSTQIRVARYNADGSLDPNFGSNGVVTTSAGTGSATASALLVQPDGKIVAGGTSSNGSKTVFTLVRYNADGSLDATFGSGGIDTTEVGDGNSSVDGLALQPDGKIVADGDAVNGPSLGVPGLARYNPDGSLDMTFGSNGIVTTPLFGSNAVTGGPLALQPDGKILLAGSYAGTWVVGRYETDGSLDSGFGDAGVGILGGGLVGRASSIALDPDGRILVAGADSDGANSNGTTDYANLLELARWNPDGTIDESFSDFGIAFFDAWTGPLSNPPPPPASPAIALQPDGKVVAAGSHSDDGGITQQFLVARFGASVLTVNLINLAGYGKGTGGEITSNPAGIDCTADFGCTYGPVFTWAHAFGAGPVTLTATPWEGYLFAGWSGGGCAGSDTCQVQMSGAVYGDKTVTATFKPAPTRALTVTKSGTGAGLITTSGLACRSHCIHGFVVGSKVTLTAQATSKWSTFTGWSEDCGGRGKCILTMSKNHKVTGTFQHFCIVPRLKGTTLPAAKRSIQARHCYLGRVTLVASSKVKRGRVVSQKPAPGRRLLGHSRVRLTISKG